MESPIAQVVVDTSLDLTINSYFNKLHHQDHLAPALPHHVNLQVHKEPLPKEEAGVLVREMNRISLENQKLTEMLTCMCEKYYVLQTHFLELKDKNSSPKRKAGDDDYGHNIGPNQISESSSSDEETNHDNKRPKQEHVIKNRVSRVLVRTDASNIHTLVVKDGYQWRKYGQKVTRDNPSPRAYFKCSFAPTCPVKKKVQRSVENPSVLVATYEGEHNHHQPCRAEFMFSSHQDKGSTIDVDNVNGTLKPSSSSRAENVDDNGRRNMLVKPETSNDEAAPMFQRFLVQQMASSLTKDPNFTAALAAAISGRIFDHTTLNL